MKSIWSEAYIDDRAEVHPSARIGRGAIIGPNVQIHEGVTVGPYTVIGGIPEHLGFFQDYDSQRSKGVVIHAGAAISEFVTIHAGTKHATVIDRYAAVFNHSHVGHDSYIGEGAMVGGHASLAGHVHIMKRAVIAGRCNFHQWAVVGAYAMLGAASFLKAHIPPGEKWMGNPGRPAGFNTIGLERAGITFDQCQELFSEEFEKLTEGKRI